MADPTFDVFCYSIENVQRQIADAPRNLGCYAVRFYSDGTRPLKEKAEVIHTFYYFPSGGTLRDEEMNILFYEPRLDRYRKYSRKNG